MESYGSEWCCITHWERDTRFGGRKPHSCTRKNSVASSSDNRRAEEQVGPMQTSIAHLMFRKQHLWKWRCRNGCMCTIHDDISSCSVVSCGVAPVAACANVWYFGRNYYIVGRWKFIISKVSPTAISL